jgi:hypothetical protein
VEISPVDAGAARRFLTERAPADTRWDPVRERLSADPGGPLAAALSTPWRLTLAVAVYDEKRDGAYVRDPRDLLDGTRDARAIRDHLLEEFIGVAVATTPRPRRGLGYTEREVRAWLTVLARYLKGNAPTGPARAGRVVGGRVLSGSDMVLHELWPLPGERRARVVAAIAAFVGLAALAVLFVLDSGIRLRPQLVGVPGLAAFAVAVSWERVWPEPAGLNLRSPDAPGIRRRLRRELWLGALTGLVAGLAFGIFFDWLAGLAFGPAFGLTAGRIGERLQGEPGEVVAALVVGMAAGLATMRRFGPTAGLGFGIMAGLTFTVVEGEGAGLAVGVAFGLMGALTSSGAGLRYVALLLCTRRGPNRLPWRLGRFLTWCYEARMIRIAGVAYQFRHRELQDFLANRGRGLGPTP